MRKENHKEEGKTNQPFPLLLFALAFFMLWVAVHFLGVTSPIHKALGTTSTSSSIIYKSKTKNTNNNNQVNNGQVTNRQAMSTVVVSRQIQNINNANNIVHTVASNTNQYLAIANDWNGSNKTLAVNYNNDKATFTNQQLDNHFLRNQSGGLGVNVVDGLNIQSADSEGRTQQVNGYLTPTSTNSSHKRPPIPLSSAPSGWCVNGQWNGEEWKGGNKINDITMINSTGSKHGYPFNQGHLIGWQFLKNPVIGNVNQVMDRGNLVVETREANAPVQLKYENMIEHALKNGSDVRIQVTPIYNNNDLIPKALHYMAKSTNNNKININIVIINAQHGLYVDYANGVNSHFLTKGGTK